MSVNEQSTTTRAGDSGEFQIAQHELEPGLLILSPVGEVDILTAPVLREHLAAAIERGVRRIVVDLSDVSFIDSVGVAALVNARRRLEGEGHVAIVADPQSYATLILEVAGVGSIVDVVPTREQAIAVVQDTG